MADLMLYFSAIPGSVFDFGTMLVAAVSAICAFKAYRNQRERAKKASACELAKYYADNIITQGSYIESVYSRSKYTNLVKDKFPLDRIHSFTCQEMEAFLGNDDHVTQDLAQKAFYVDPSCILASKLQCTSSVIDRSNFMAAYTMPSEDDTPFEIRNQSYLQTDFSNSIYMLLNDLEWFSMQCRYGVADEKLLYQSLHQTFLSDVQMLYFHISSRNINSEDKLFTNLIWLFQRWKSRLEKFKKKNQKDINRANRQVERAREKASRAGRSFHHGKSI